MRRCGSTGKQRRCHSGRGIEEVDEERWREGWDLKVFGYVEMTRALYREMKARGRGGVVNVIGTAGDQRPAVYAAGVSANATLTRALGGESLDHGVRVVGVSPGDMTNERGTEFLRRQAAKEFGDPDRWREPLARLPGGRVATSEEWPTPSCSSPARAPATSATWC